MSAAGAVFANFSRSDESEADEVGLRFMVGAGMDPNGFPQMFRILLDERKRNPNAVEAFFSTHPLAEDRIDATQAMIANYRASAAARLAARQQRVPKLQAAAGGIAGGAGEVARRKSLNPLLCSGIREARTSMTRPAGAHRRVVRRPNSARTAMVPQATILRSPWRELPGRQWSGSPTGARERASYASELRDRTLHGAGLPTMPR